MADVQLQDRYLEHSMDVAEMCYYIELALSLANMITIGILYTLKFHEMKTTNVTNNLMQNWGNPPKRAEIRENLLNEWSENNKRKSQSFAAP